MSFKKKPGTEEDVFCLTFPLICEPQQRDRLDQYFSNAQHMENCLIAWVRAQVVQLERTRKWRRNQKHITKVCAEIGEVQKLILSGKAKLEKLNEKLKSINQMKWVCKMNNVRNRAEEIVIHDYIYKGQI